jgi:hypothetical protein
LYLEINHLKDLDDIKKNLTNQKREAIKNTIGKEDKHLTILKENGIHF